MIYVYSLVILILSLGFGTFGADVTPKHCIEEQVLKLLAKWRTGDVAGSPLPPLDIINIPSVGGVYDGFGIKITYTTGNMLLTGADNFTVEELDVLKNDLTQTIKVSTSVHIPVLMLTGERYNLKGRAYLLVSLKGAGAMTAVFEDVKATLALTLVSKDTTTAVDNINLLFSVGNIHINLADSSWPINDVLNKEAPKIVESYRSSIGQTTQDALKLNINNYFAKMTFPQVLQSIGNDNCIL